MIDFPTKKIFYFFIPVIVVMGTFLAIRNNTKTPDLQGLQVVANQKTERAALPETDLNNNKIPDWQESLASSQRTINPATTSGSMSVTEEASINLYKDYLSLKKTGALGEATVGLLADNFESTFPAIGIETYTVQNLTLMPLKNKDSLKEYGNTVIQIRNLYSNRLSDRTLPANVTLEDDAFWQVVKEGAGLHKSMAEELLRVEVPSEIATEHLRLVNNYAESVLALEDFADTRNDPLKGLQGISTYMSLQEEELEILSKIGTFLETSGILFGAGEQGYFFSSL